MAFGLQCVAKMIFPIERWLPKEPADITLVWREYSYYSGSSQAKERLQLVSCRTLKMSKNPNNVVAYFAVPPLIGFAIIVHFNNTIQINLHFLDE